MYNETMNIDEAYQLARKHYQAGNLQEAEDISREILRFRPNDSEAYNNLGVILEKEGRIAEAIACYRKAMCFNPRSAEAYNNLGDALQYTGQLDEAIVCYKKGLEIGPEIAWVYSNLGRALLAKGTFEEAVVWYEKFLQIYPDIAVADGDLLLAFVLTGKFYNIFERYTIRWRKRSPAYQNISQPFWDGSDISGKTILLYAGGFGDNIWFIRYAPIIAAQMGAKIIYECPKELMTLLKDYEGISQIILRGEERPHFDVHCVTHMIPLVMQRTNQSISFKFPYINVDQSLIQQWKDKIILDTSKLRIGLFWATGNADTQDGRSCPLKLFLPLNQFDDVTFYSLQKEGFGKEQIRNLSKDMRIFDYTDDIKDFADTAALIENLDLVISIDSAVAHLAGSLGKPVWTLAPHVFNWLWLISPWYPTMRFFRQSSHGDWESVIAQVNAELLKLVNKN